MTTYVIRRTTASLAMAGLGLAVLAGCATSPGFGVEQRADTANPPIQTGGNETQVAGTTAAGSTAAGESVAQANQSQVQLYDDMAALRREVQRLQAVVEEQQQSLNETEQRNRELYQALEARLSNQQPVVSRETLNQQVLNQPTTNPNGQPNMPRVIENRTVVGTNVGNSQANSTILRNSDPSVGNTGLNSQQPVTGTTPGVSTGTPGNANGQVLQQGGIAGLPSNEPAGETVIIGSTAGTLSGTPGAQDEQGTQGVGQNADTGNTTGVEGNNAGLRVVTIPASNPEQPTSTTGSVVGGTVGRELQPATPAAQASYDAALDLLKQSRFNDAIAAFENMLARHGDTDLADDATFWVSEARYVSRDFAPALAGYQTVLNEYPTSERVPESLLKIGVIQAEMGAIDDAKKTYQMVMERFPGSRVAVSAQGRLDRISN